MRFFLKYLKDRRFVIIAYIVFCCVFAVTFYLYHLPLLAVVYPSIICFLIGVVFIALDFRRAQKKHYILFKLYNEASCLIENLPDSVTSEDEDYQTIIRFLIDEQRRFENETQLRFSDMTQYYTIWVHQIKTPIASMNLRLQNEDSELSRRLSNDLFRIEQYVEMVLTYLRLDSDSTDYVIKPYSLDFIIKNCLRKFSGEFITKKLSLKYEPLDFTVVTDEKWLTFVIEQILSNALKYTMSGYIKIYMIDNRFLCIEDTGIGIAPEDLPRVFEKGYTGYNGRKDKKASGIGLYLCKRICGNLGHKISVSSSANCGTTVSIDLYQDVSKKE